MNTLRLILCLIVALLASFRFANSQAIGCDHSSTRMSRFKQDGFMPIVARNYDGEHIEWTLADDQGTYAGTLTVTKETKLPANFPKAYKGNLWWAIYSSCDFQVYEIADMTAEQTKAFRKFNPR